MIVGNIPSAKISMSLMLVPDWNLLNSLFKSMMKNSMGIFFWNFVNQKLSASPIGWQSSSSKTIGIEDISLKSSWCCLSW